MLKIYIQMKIVPMYKLKHYPGQRQRASHALLFTTSHLAKLTRKASSLNTPPFYIGFVFLITITHYHCLPVDAQALLLSGLLAQRLRYINPGVGEVLEHVAAGQRGQQAQQVVEQFQQLPVAGDAQDLVRESEPARFACVLAARTQPANEEQ